MFFKLLKLSNNNFKKNCIGSWLSKIFSLNLLNANGQVNPKNCDEVFETIKIFLRKINNNKKFLMKIFYIFFAELFEDKKTKNININYEYFTNIKIIPLNYYTFEYLSNIIKLF